MACHRVPPEFEADVRLNHAKGLRPARIVDWLRDYRRIRVTIAAVTDLLAADRAGTDPVAQGSQVGRAEELWDALTRQEEALDTIEREEARPTSAFTTHLVKLRTDLTEAKGRLLAREAKTAAPDGSERDLDHFLESVLAAQAKGEE